MGPAWERKGVPSAHPPSLADRAAQHEVDPWYLMPVLSPSRQGPPGMPARAPGAEETTPVSRRRPTMFVPFGVVEYDADDRMVCTLCGKSWAHLASHAWMTHGLRAREYRSMAGLRENIGLVGRRLAARISARNLSRMAVNSEMMKRMQSEAHTPQARQRCRRTLADERADGRIVPVQRPFPCRYCSELVLRYPSQVGDSCVCPTCLPIYRLEAGKRIRAIDAGLRLSDAGYRTQRLADLAKAGQVNADRSRLPERPCKICGQPTRGTRVVDSDACLRESRRRVAAAGRAAYPKQCVECGMPVRARGRCSLHYQRLMSAGAAPARSARLTAVQAAEIRCRRMAGEVLRTIAADYGKSLAAISHAARRAARP